MKRNYKTNPKHIFSLRYKMKTFIDLLNKVEIFNELIPYMVIHRGEKFYSSKLELNLTFKDFFYNKYIDASCDHINELFTNYILSKLNTTPNIVVTTTDNQHFFKLIDKSNEDFYLTYTVAYIFDLFSEFHNINENNLNNCKLVVRIYNKNTPLFEISKI